MQDRLLIVGKKIGMTQLFDQNNRLMPVTVISAEPCRVSQIKTEGSDGYKAVQIAYQEKNHANKAVMGHLEKANVNVIEEMISIVQAQRAYEMNQKGVQAADEMARSASQLQK